MKSKNSKLSDLAVPIQFVLFVSGTVLGKMGTGGYSWAHVKAECEEKQKPGASKNAPGLGKKLSDRAIACLMLHSTPRTTTAQSVFHLWLICFIYFITAEREREGNRGREGERASKHVRERELICQGACIYAGEDLQEFFSLTMQVLGSNAG